MSREIPQYTAKKFRIHKMVYFIKVEIIKEMDGFRLNFEGGSKTEVVVWLKGRFGEHQRGKRKKERVWAFSVFPTLFHLRHC